MVEAGGPKTEACLPIGDKPRAGRPAKLLPPLAGRTEVCPSSVFRLPILKS